MIKGSFQVTLEDPGETGRYRLLKDVFAADNLYLEFQILGGGTITALEPPMVPRQRLVSVPFAARAGQVRKKLFPPGVIVMWSGSAAEVPAGWCLCDGGSCAAPDGTVVTTPDLRDKFILGANSPAEIGSTGGSEDPAIDPPGAWSYSLSAWSFHSYPGLTKDATKVRWQYFDIPGFQTGPRNLYPKFYKLAFMMKL